MSLDKELTLRGYGEQVLLLCAVRYAMGRHTYMPSLVCDVIREHFSELEPSCVDGSSAEEKIAGFEQHDEVRSAGRGPVISFGSWEVGPDEPDGPSAG